MMEEYDPPITLADYDAKLSALFLPSGQTYVRELLPTGSTHRSQRTYDEALTILGEGEERVERLEAARAIPEDKRALEASLSMRKWFDYRFITPTAATRLFTKAYTDNYRKLWHETRDRDEANLKKPIRFDDPFQIEGRDLSSLWIARQYADAERYPYEFFTYHVMRVAVESNRKFFPRPNQLADDKLVARARPVLEREWRRSMEARRPYSALPQYLVENYKGLAAQDDHQEHIVKLIRAVAGTAMSVRLAVRRYVFDARVLSEDKAKSEFGTAIVDRARSEPPALEEIPTIKLVSDAELRPSCYGLPARKFEDGWPCDSCPFAEPCTRSVELLRSTLKSVWGHDDPRKAKQRAKDAERQRKHRARKRAATAAT